MYIYESHMGWYYWLEEEAQNTYCDSCGDSDFLLGYANNAKETVNLIKTKSHFADRYYVKDIKRFAKSIPYHPDP